MFSTTLFLLVLVGVSCKHDDDDDDGVDLSMVDQGGCVVLDKETPLELLTPTIVSHLLAERQSVAQIVHVGEFSALGGCSAYSVDLSLLCHENTCFTHHFSLFVRVVPSNRAFLDTDAHVVRLLGSVDDAARNNTALGFERGHTVQLAPYEVQAMPYTITVRTPLGDEFVDSVPERLVGSSFRLLVTLVGAQRVSAGVPTPLAHIEVLDKAMKRYMLYDRLPFDFAHTSSGQRVQLQSVVRQYPHVPASCWALDDAARERCIASKYLDQLNTNFIGTPFPLCLAANFVRTGRARACRMWARRIGEWAARVLRSSDAHMACVPGACDDECFHGVVSELVYKLRETTSHEDDDDDKEEGSAAHAISDVTANRDFLDGREFLRGVAHVCASMGRRDNGAFSCAIGAGAGLFRLAGGGKLAGFDDLVAALKTCYGVMKIANTHNLPHFSVERCTKGAFAGWMRYKSKHEPRYSEFGHDITNMCVSPHQRLQDMHEFDHNEFELCLQALGEQVALKSNFDAGKMSTLCHRLPAGELEICNDAALNFTRYHDKASIEEPPMCADTPENAPRFRSTATLLAADITGQGQRIDIASVYSSWFDAVGFESWQIGQPLPTFDPSNPPKGYTAESSYSTDDLPQRMDGKRRRDETVSGADDIVHINASASVLSGQVRRMLNPLGLRSGSVVLYVEYDAQGADLQIELMINDTIPGITVEKAYARARVTGTAMVVVYVVLALGVLLAAGVSIRYYHSRQHAEGFKSFKFEA